MSEAPHAYDVYQARRQRLRERCAAAGDAAAVVSRPANIRYLTGTAPERAALLLGVHDPGADVLLCAVAPGARPEEGGPTRRSGSSSWTAPAPTRRSPPPPSRCARTGVPSRSRSTT